MSKIDQERISKLVQELLAVPKGDHTEGEVIIAFSKAVALVANLIGQVPGGHYEPEEVLKDMLELIEDYFDTQQIVSVEEYYEH